MFNGTRLDGKLKFRFGWECECWSRKVSSLWMYK